MDSTPLPRSTRSNRLTRSLAVALSVTLLGLATGTPAVHAVEASTRPADGVFHLEGRGYGHGRGLSQWGAYGAADAGLVWTDILAFYYPGTTRTGAGSGPIKVLISADTGADVRVDAIAGLRLTSGGNTWVLPTGSTYDSWRLVRSGTTIALQRLDGTTWTTITPGIALGATVGFVTPGTTTRLVLPSGAREALRGEVRAAPQGTTGLRSVAVMDMDEYLRAVVPSEMPASWHIQALRAQTVAARTYAAHLRSTSSAKAWNTCDTTACQVFKGTATYSASGALVAVHEQARTDQAIADTAGVVLYYGASVAFTQFSSANGGWTAAGSHAYQVAKADPYDGRIASSAHAWTTELAVSRVEAVYSSVGALRELAILERSGGGDWGGRVVSVRITGSRGAVTVTGDQFRSAFGLRSSWFHVQGTSAHPRDLSGDGFADVLAIGPTGQMVLYPGNADGQLATPLQLGRGWTGGRPVTQVGDWNGDERTDVMAIGPEGYLALYPGDGSGGLGAGAVVGQRWHGISELLGVGDLDGDGFDDLVTRRTTDQSLWLYPGTAAGLPGTARQIGQGWGGYDLLTAVGDMDGDGRPDVVARHSASGDLIFFRGTTSGGLASAGVVGARWSGVHQLAGPGDLGADGSTDLVAVLSDGTLHRYAWTGTGLSSAGSLGGGWSSSRLVG